MCTGTLLHYEQTVSEVVGYTLTLRANSQRGREVDLKRGRVWGPGVRRALTPKEAKKEAKKEKKAAKKTKKRAKKEAKRAKKVAPGR